MLKVGTIVQTVSGYHNTGKVCLPFPLNEATNKKYEVDVEALGFSFVKWNDGTKGIIHDTNLQIRPACAKCGNAVEEGWHHKIENWCNSCNHWQKRLDEGPTPNSFYALSRNTYGKYVNDYNYEMTVPDTYVLYNAQDKVFKDTSGCGSGGRLFRFKFPDRTVKLSNNVWSCGEVPAVWLSEFEQFRAEII